MEFAESSRPDLSSVEAAALDWQAALAAMGSDPDLLRAVTEILVVEAPRQVAAIRVAILAGNAKDLRRAAHTLKGSLRYYGPTSASDLADQLEQLGRSGQVVGTDELPEKLDSAVASVVRALVDYLRQTARSS